MKADEPIELDDARAGEFGPVDDARPRMPEPPPVRLVAVEDVTLPATAGLERELDAFYVGLLRFERAADAPHAPGERVPGAGYHAENVDLRFVLHEGLVERESLRPIGIEVQSLARAEADLVAAEIEYLRQRGITPGTDSLLLRDPAGNWLELFGAPRVA